MNLVFSSFAHVVALSGYSSGCFGTFHLEPELVDGAFLSIKHGASGLNLAVLLGVTFHKEIDIY